MASGGLSSYGQAYMLIAHLLVRPQRCAAATRPLHRHRISFAQRPPARALPSCLCCAAPCGRSAPLVHASPGSAERTACPLAFRRVQNAGGAAGGLQGRRRPAAAAAGGGGAVGPGLPLALVLHPLRPALRRVPARRVGVARRRHHAASRRQLQQQCVLVPARWRCFCKGGRAHTVDTCRFAPRAPFALLPAPGGLVVRHVSCVESFCWPGGRSVDVPRCLTPRCAARSLACSRPPAVQHICCVDPLTGRDITEGAYQSAEVRALACRLHGGGMGPPRPHHAERGR